MPFPGLSTPQQLPLRIPPLTDPIRYTDSILLVGSCFTEHIAGRLAAHRFRSLQNPHGILFNPLSVAASIKGYAEEKRYGEDALFYLNETWNSWDHHSRFSNTDKAAALSEINASQKAASEAVRNARWIIMTLGSAFQYYLKENDRPVANNHRAPGGLFEKRLLQIPLISSALAESMEAVRNVNPGVQFLLTISPVRHIRDGVVDNNRSKARLIEAVHGLVERHSDVHYFPAYEMLIDVLRDYRYYDVDMVHPNYSATSIVWDEFVKACIDPQVWPLMEAVRELTTARAHRPRFPDTEGHQSFMAGCARKAETLMQSHPELDLREELGYFRGK